MPVSFKKDMKELLFDKKYKGYLIIIVAVILSVDWTFLTQCIDNKLYSIIIITIIF
jgi:hypothetical protein